VSDVSAGFREPFAEQLAALRLRFGTLFPSAKWDDLDRSQHERAFMVAGAVKADLLADLAGAVDRAVAQGTTFETFKGEFRNIVDKHGWHGWTGEGTRKGEEWRMRVIYRTNMATSWAAGRMAQLVAGDFKFWVYKHGGSQEPRLQHLAWDGIALESDHPFWATHAPPNGWGCSCLIYGARSEAGIRRVGGNPGKTLPDGWQARDPKTGAPVGIDKGWDYAVGRGVAEDVRALRPKLDSLPDRPSIDLIQSWLRQEFFARWLADPKGAFPLVRIPAEDAARIGATRQVADLSAETAAKQLREHPELSVFEYAEAQQVVSAATEVIQDGPKSLIYLFEVPGETGHVLVVKATRTGEGLFVTSFRRITGTQPDRDKEIRRLRRKQEK
jgi:hypothetical protein